MCFSAKASFILSGVLALIGLLSIRKVQNKSQLYFASIPYLFALQQFCEGILWLILTNQISPDFKNFMIYMYLFFAFIIWPIWMPFSLIKLETNNFRKKLLNLTLITGALNSIYGIYYLMLFGATAIAQSCHIIYNVNVQSQLIYTISYLIAVILPFFITSIKYMWIIGIFLIVSLILSYYIYFKFLISVWCFFSAALSIGVYWIINNRNK